MKSNTRLSLSQGISVVVAHLKKIKIKSITLLKPLPQPSQSTASIDPLSYQHLLEMREPDPLNCNTACCTETLRVPPPVSIECAGIILFIFVIGRRHCICMRSPPFFFFFFANETGPNLSACARITHTRAATPLFNVSFKLISRLTSAQCGFQSPIKYHLVKDVHSRFFFSFAFSPVLVLNGGRGEG